MCYRLLVMLFFFKEETAYEMRIRDGSSDVCSSDLGAPAADGAGRSIQGVRHAGEARGQSVSPKPDDVDVIQAPFAHARDQMAGVVVGEGRVVDEPVLAADAYEDQTVTRSGGGVVAARGHEIVCDRHRFVLPRSE